ncbi:MAG: flavodoxin family protein [Planctomycetaceae bacterium]|jgi:multimeric flavodoxin WrbA|nr:flavodoxin family protein [Planctomycetaceae bacterium]
MKLLAINGSPRKEKNTAQLLEKVCAGAASKQAETELVHLRNIHYQGCVSCFQCKSPNGKSYGRCGLVDELTPILQKAHEADVLVLGSPFYFSMESSLMRAFMERLWFQYLLYTNLKPPLSPKKKAVALVYTMGAQEEYITVLKMDSVISVSKGLMERFFAPCEVFLCCDDMLFDDYSKYETDFFDVSAKLKRHQEVFPQELEQAFALGTRLVE